MTRQARRRLWGVVAVAAAAVTAALVWNGRHDSAAAPVTAVARRGEFVVDLATSGQIEAVHSRVVSRRRVGQSWNGAQIVQLAPEGSVVKEADFLAQLDGAEATQQIEETRNTLLNARAELSRQTAESAAQRAEMESAVLTARYSHEQAQLRTEAMKFEAEVRRREQELELKKSELALQDAQGRLEAQDVIAQAEREKVEFAVRQAQLQVTQAEEALAALTITAPEAGLVVYKSYRQGKIKVGDQVWPGMDLIELPDLSEMRVRTRVNEVDVRQVATDQDVTVRVDALSGQEFSGKVTRVAALARTEGEAKVKVFDVDVLVTGPAGELRPGMTAQCRIIVDRKANVVTVPLEAVFERDGKSVVFVVPGNGRPVPVTIGARSDDFAEITAGLAGGETVALRDPAQPRSDRGRKEAAP